MALLAPLLAGAAGAPDQGALSSDRLLLREIRAAVVPVGFEPAGGALSSDGDVVLWSRTRGDLFVLGSDGVGSRLDFGSNDPPTSAAFLDGGATIAVMVGRSGREVRIDRQGNLIADRFLGGWVDSAPVHAAAFDGRGWLVVTRSLDDNLALRHVAASGQVTQLLTLRGVQHRSQLPDSFARVSAHAIAAGGRYLVTLWWPPWTTVIIDSTGRTERVLRPVSHESMSRFTLAVPALPLDRGFIQTLADLQSDIRLHQLFDARGRPARHITSGVRAGLVAVSLTGQLILALRRSDVLEAVTYQWSWHQP